MADLSDRVENNEFSDKVDNAELSNKVNDADVKKLMYIASAGVKETKRHW